MDKRDQDLQGLLPQAYWSIPNPNGIIQVDTDRRPEMGLHLVDPFINYTADSGSLHHLYARTTNLSGVVRPVATLASVADEARRSMRFESLYQDGDSLFAMLEFVKAIFVRSTGRELTQQDLDAIPMLDIFVGLPSVNETLYFAGGIDTHGRKGLAATFDKGVYSTTWVNGQSKYLLTNGYTNLPIAPLVGEHPGAFTVEGLLDLRGVVGEHPSLLNNILIANGVSVMVGVAPLEEPTYLLADSYLNNYMYNDTSGNKDYGLVTMGGGSGFGQMGRSVTSEQRAQRAEAPRNIDKFVIYNLHPVIIDGLDDIKVLLPPHLR